MYGLIVFTNKKNKPKEIFASYLTGFSGFYTHGLGGIINGEFYKPEDLALVNELLELCNKKKLNGNKSNIDLFNSSIRTVIDSVSYVEYAERKNSWSGLAYVFCFLTSKGLYIKELTEPELHSSVFYPLFKKIDKLKNKIIKFHSN